MLFPPQQIPKLRLHYPIHSTIQDSTFSDRTTERPIDPLHWRIPHPPAVVSAWSKVRNIPRGRTRSLDRHLHLHTSLTLLCSSAKPCNPAPSSERCTIEIEIVSVTFPALAVHQRPDRCLVFHYQKDQLQRLETPPLPRLYHLSSWTGARVLIHDHHHHPVCDWQKQATTLDSTYPAISASAHGGLLEGRQARQKKWKSPNNNCEG